VRFKKQKKENKKENKSTPKEKQPPNALKTFFFI